VLARGRTPLGPKIDSTWHNEKREKVHSLTFVSFRRKTEIQVVG